MDDDGRPGLMVEPGLGLGNVLWKLLRGWMLIGKGIWGLRTEDGGWRSLFGEECEGGNWRE